MSFHSVAKKNDVVVESIADIESVDEEEEFDSLKLDAENEKYEFEEGVFKRYQLDFTHGLPFWKEKKSL